jgi:hypothetical protein
MMDTPSATSAFLRPKVIRICPCGMHVTQQAMHACTHACGSRANVWLCEQRTGQAREAAHTEAMEPRVTDIESHSRKVRSLAKYTFGSTRFP